MTPETLEIALHALFPDADLPSIDTPARLLRVLEERLQQDASLHQRLSPLVVHINHYLRCRDGIPTVIGTVRIERLVRWTDWTVSFDGRDLHTGEETRIRTLRCHTRADPFYSRQLFREGHLLKNSGLANGIRFVEGPWPSMTQPLAVPN